MGLADVEARLLLKDDEQLELLRAHTLIGLGQFALTVTDYDFAERCHHEALKVYRRQNHGFGIGRGLYNLGLVAEYQGNAIQAEEYYRTIYTNKLDQLSTYGVGLLRRGLSATALARGDLEEAYAFAQQGVAALRDANERLYLIQTLLQLGSSRWPSAAGLRRSAMRSEAVGILREIRGQVWLVDALMVVGCAVAHATPHRAAQLFAAAEHLRTQHHAPLAPKTYAQIVPYVRSVRDRLGADAFTEAWRTGESLSLDQALALALAQPAIAGADSIPRAPALPASATATSPAGPDELTARELEVLQLLASGLTNQDIADQLIMSVHTVRSHVKAIFGKLDVTSRAAATRAALDRGLVDR